ncbi:mannose-1-phosphate guanylyltransferase [Tenacibaculum sp. 190524A02b]|uniref:mannose-1-phosphate guanylyltransferase n=1 Tax=Tenacibaculum vairaonense TaxID=3137860 RepID=UPI0031FAF20C
MKNKIINIILSGGSGTRLWPLSRTSNPKQFLKIFNELSLFQHTVKRNANIAGEYCLITNESQIEEAEIQIKELGVNGYSKIVEPTGRNTAPAIALAALNLEPDDIMIITPSDHMIKDEDLYVKSMERAVELAQENFLVTFGIKPKKPNTGFGYIEFKDEDVISFREKPDQKTAEDFLKRGNFNWNSGMFCFKAGVFLDELKKYNQEMFDACLYAFSTIKNDIVNIDAMNAIPSDSIDYAVLEKSSKIKSISSNFYWTDLGTFDAIADYFDEGNEVDILEKEENFKTYSFSKKKIFTSVENLIVVSTEDSIVILEKGNTDAIKDLYNKAKSNNPSLTK